jgi:uncharacterized protein
VIVLGEARAVTDPDEKIAALEAFAERIAPGRWADARPPTAQELKATSILSLPLDEASAKIRTGHPADEEDDLQLDAWAGIVPIATVRRDPVPAPDLQEGIEVPGYLRDGAESS